MKEDNSADHHKSTASRPIANFYDLVQFTFKADFGFPNPWWRNLLGGYWCKSGYFKLIHAKIKISGTHDHLRPKRFGYNIHNKFLRIPDVNKRILFFAVPASPPRSKHDGGWFGANAIKIREWGHIMFSIFGTGGYKGNGSGHNGPDHEFMGFLKRNFVWIKDHDSIQE